MSEGKKYDSGKPMMDLLPPSALIEVAKVLTFGAQKYSRGNWANGIQYSRVYSAALRHMAAWNSGEDIDPETGISHIAHAATNLLFLTHFLAHPDAYDHLDDRWILKDCGTVIDRGST